MLNAMRKHATSWVVKALLGLLIVSFAVWGIGDVLRSPQLGGAVAEVAGREISSQQVLREFEQRYRALQEQTGSGLTRQQAVSFGLLNQALEVTVARALVDTHARDLGVSVSDDELAAEIRGNPLFGGPQSFDRDSFQLYLRSMGVGEETYLAMVRSDMLRRRVIESMTAPVAAPGLLARQLLAFSGEQRRGRALIVDADEIEVPAPDDATLQAYLDAHAKEYEAPEYRAVTLVVITPDELAAEIAIDEEVLRGEYESRAAEFRTPETRSIEQLVAGDQETALEAAEMAASGRSLQAVAEAMRGRGVERTELGPLREGDLPEALDRAVFALEEGALSEPVESPFGWHLIRVREVTPETVRSFADVREELDRELRLRRAADQLPGFATQLDDEIAAGTPLEEAARNMALEPLVIPAVDREGENKEREAVAADRLTPEILDAIFTAGQGEPSLLNETEEGHFYMFRVDAIEPARPRTLEEARDVLSEAWRKEQQAERARARAEELRTQVTDAASLEALAAGQQGLILSEVGPVTRADQGYLAGLTPEAIRALFATPPGSVAAQPVPALEGSAVLLVEEVIPATLDPAQEEQAQLALADQLRGDILNAYEAALRQRYPVAVDTGQLAQMMETQAQ